MKLIDLNVSIKLNNNDEVIVFLKDNESDIITLQEVMRGIDDTVYDRYNNSKLIKKEISKDYKYNFFGALWVAPYHIKNGVVSKDFGGIAEQGNEVISKYPIIKANNIFYYKNYGDFTDVTNFRKTDHPRALEQVILEVENKKLQLLNIHGIWTEGKIGDERTLKQNNFLLKTALENDLPTIIVGDFNLAPESKSIEILNKSFKNLITEYNIRSTRPTVRDGLDIGNNIDDYIFANDKIKINDFKVVVTDISDHYPLLLDFDIIN